MTSKSDNPEEEMSESMIPTETTLLELTTPTGYFTDSEGVTCLEYSFTLTDASKVSLYVSYNEDPIGIVGDS
jgi:hypothetical protein